MRVFINLIILHRCLSYMGTDGNELLNKRNLQMLPKFPELKDIYKHVQKRCILDGEVVVMRNGVPDFYELQRRTLMSDPFKIQLTAKMHPASFVAYDCLYYDTEEILLEPLTKRKEILEDLVKEESPQFAVSRFVVGQGTTLFQLAAGQELEGVVAKRMNSLYYMGKRSKDWVKFKRMADQDFIVAGYIEKGIHTYSIVLGQYRNGNLIYKGHVTSGVTKHSLEVLEKNNTNPFIALPIGSGNEQAVWVVPDHVCVVEYMPNTKNYLRQPLFKGYRTDVSPEDILE